jgi:hypothetical protein
MGLHAETYCCLQGSKTVSSANANYFLNKKIKDYGSKLNSNKYCFTFRKSQQDHKVSSC